MDTFHDSIIKIKDKQFNQKLLDKSIQKYNRRFLSESDSDTESNDDSGDQDEGTDNPREQLEALAELLEHLDNQDFSDAAEEEEEDSQEEDSSSPTDEDEGVELDALDLDDPELPIETIFNALVHTKASNDFLIWPLKHGHRTQMAAEIH